MHARPGLAVAAVPAVATLLLSAGCDKSDIGSIYYIVALIVGSALVAYITKRYKKGYKASLENIARKYNGEVKSFGGGAGYDAEIQGAHGGHRFTFKAEAEGKGSKLTLRIHGKPIPPPIRLFLADQKWWTQAAATFGMDPGYGQPYKGYVFVCEPADVAAVLFNKPGVYDHLEAMRRSIPLSLFIGPRFVDYCLIFHGQQITSQPKFYNEEIMSWWIEEMVAFTAVLEQE